MAERSTNTQLFALRQPPPDRLTVCGCAYVLQTVFKHDFYAATGLYHRQGAGAAPEKIIVKFGREQVFCGLSMRWIGKRLADREQKLHALVDHIPGVQRWVQRISDTAYALEYIEGVTLDRFGPPPDGFFDRLVELIRGFHAAGCAYGDLNKRSNIVVGPDNQPGLIDFQICLRDLPDAPGPVRWLRARAVRYLQAMDLYHLYKHKRRLRPDELTEQEEALSRRRGPLLRAHRKLYTPLRKLRRRFLTHQHKTGRLVSPSAELETEHQPEKATWQKSD